MSAGAAGGGPPGGGPGPEAPPGSPWAAGRWTWLATPDRRILLAAVLLQLVLAALFAHSYDARVFLSTGYLVGTGHTPYVARDLLQVFHHAQFNMVTAIGYPPPWPLALGAIYRGTFALVPDLHLYAFAIKLPVIAANVGLAYLTGAVLRSMGAAPQVARRAWIALLLNPFVIYVGAAWGQIDALVALAAVAALVLVAARRPASAAVLLALAVCIKPTAAPLALAAFLYLWHGSARRALTYVAVFIAAVAVFYVLPFFALGWDSAPLRNANAHFVMSGTMSLSTVARLFRDPVTLPGHWWLLGLAWIPALAVTALFFVRRGEGVDDLFRNGLALVLVMFLTRTWLAEPNIVLLLPLVLVPASLGEIDRRFFTALWVIALLYTAANLSPLHVLWLTWPRAMVRALAFMGGYSQATLVAGVVFVIAWQVVGWWLVVTCLGRRPAGVPLPAAAGREEVAT